MTVSPNITIKHVETPEELKRALAVRYEVFVLEQGYSVETEQSNMEEEKICQHWIATLDNVDENGNLTKVDVGNIRLINKSEKVAKLGRLAVLSSARGLYVGQKLVQQFIGYCKENGYHSIVLHSQNPRRGFYEKLGFVTEKGDDQIFEEAGTPHVRLWMRNL